MLEVPLGPLFSAFGLAATVTVDGELPVETSVIWQQPDMTDVPEGTQAFRGRLGADFQRREARRVLGLRRNQVPVAPIGTIVEAPELAGGVVKRWRVDAPHTTEADLLRVVVVEAPE